ncbi:hypothetical protein DOLIC_00062 [Dolichomitus sp. PSUC_FEM 10030005]|nr:hypothetical protein [Dolichomitus sp. PSUC_FEM 10030005]
MENNNDNYDPNYVSKALDIIFAMRDDQVRQLLQKHDYSGSTLSMLQRENIYLHGMLREINISRDKLDKLTSQITDGVEDHAIKLGVDERSIVDNSVNGDILKRVNNKLKKYNSARDELINLDKQFGMLQKSQYESTVNRLFVVARRHIKESLIAFVKTFQNIVESDSCDVKNAEYNFLHEHLEKSSLRAASLVRLQGDTEEDAFAAKLDTLRLARNNDADSLETDSVKKIIRQFILSIYSYNYLRKKNKRLKISPYTSTLVKYRSIQRQLKKSILLK